METMNKNETPTPEQRPDLYDDFDYRDVAPGYKTGVGVPDRIQKMIDAKKAGAAQK